MRYYSDNGFYEVNEFPGCTQLAVSNNAYIYPRLRGKGLGQQEHKRRLHDAARMGYDAIICTVISTNGVEKHILKKNGWQYLATFDNRKTEHKVEIWARDLDDVPRTDSGSEYAEWAKENKPI